MRRVLLIVAVAVASSAVTAAAIVLPASAAGDDPTLRDRMERFESCMREQGFDLGPETTVVITPDGIRVNGEEVDAEAFRNARRECGAPFRGLVPRLGRGELPELGERMERLRDCLEAEET